MSDNLDPGPFLEAYIKCLNAIIITQPVQSSFLRVSVMPRRKGNQLKASRQQRNAGGQFSNNREIFEVGDDVSETEVDEIDDLDCRERGWHSEQDDNGSESDDPSCDEFDEESVCSQDHDFSRDEDFQTAISAVDSTSDEDQSDSDIEDSSTLRSSDPANFLTWKKGADKGLIGNKMPKGSSKMTKWRQDSKTKEEQQRIKRIRTDETFAKVDVIFNCTDDGLSSDAEDHIVDTVAMLNKFPEEKLLDLP